MLRIRMSVIKILKRRPGSESLSEGKNKKPTYKPNWEKIIMTLAFF